MCITTRVSIYKKTDLLVFKKREKTPTSFLKDKLVIRRHFRLVGFLSIRTHVRRNIFKFFNFIIDKLIRKKMPSEKRRRSLLKAGILLIQLGLRLLNPIGCDDAGIVAREKCWASTLLPLRALLCIYLWTYITWSRGILGGDLSTAR